MKKQIAKIEINREICIGCGTCAGIAPEAFELREGKSHLKDNWENAQEEDILMAARSCPMKAIALYGKKGEKIET